jgi:hypothetical protein
MAIRAASAGRRPRRSSQLLTGVSTRAGKRASTRGTATTRRRPISCPASQARATSASSVQTIRAARTRGCRNEGATGATVTSTAPSWSASRTGGTRRPRSVPADWRPVGVRPHRVRPDA